MPRNAEGAARIVAPDVVEFFRMVVQRSPAIARWT